MTAQILTPDDVVMLSDECLNGSAREIVDFNVAIVNWLRREMLRISEISREAVQSYFVDYYFAEVENGGFAQYVRNSNWAEETVSFVEDGLAAIGATRHLALFQKGKWLVSNEPSKLKNLLTGEFFGPNEERDRFNSVTTQFYELAATEDITALNAAWLKSRQNKLVLPLDELRQELFRRADAVPDREARKVEALARAPRYMKIIQALCDESGQALETITAGDPNHDHEGVRLLAWHFLTDKGHHYMIEATDRLIMFSGTTNELVVELPAERLDSI